MNVCLSLFKNRFHLSWVKHSEQLHYGLCFCKVCVFAFISEFCSIEYLKLSFGHLFYLTYLCSLGKFPSCCQLLLNHMFKCIIRGELPVSSTLLFTFILYLILHHIYQA